MNQPLKNIFPALLLGTSTLISAPSHAQAQTQSFGNQLAQMQALSGTGTYTFHPAPKVDPSPRIAAHPSFDNQFAALQAESSNSTQFEPTGPVRSAVAADTARGEPFAEKFAAMQAASSNSGEYGLPNGAASIASADTTRVATSASKPTLRERLASLFHHDANSSLQQQY